MTCQLEPMLDSYGDSITFRLTRLAAGDKQTAQDNLRLAMATDPLLLEAVQRAGVRKLVAGGLAHYRELVKVAGPHVAAHPEEVRS